MSNEKLTIEEIIEKIENLIQKLESGELDIDKSLKAYEECVKLYNLAQSKLTDAKQKIEIYRPDTDTVENFDED